MGAHANGVAPAYTPAMVKTVAGYMGPGAFHGRHSSPPDAVKPETVAAEMRAIQTLGDHRAFKGDVFAWNMVGVWLGRFYGPEKASTIMDRATRLLPLD